MGQKLKNVFFTIFVVAVVVVFALFLVRVFTGEDNWVCEKGVWVKHGQPFAPQPKQSCAGNVLIVPEDKTEEPVVEDNKPVVPPVEEKNITVSEPKAGMAVLSPVTIKGTARVFESQFNYIIKDSTGAVLAEGTGMANSPDAGQFGPYEISAAFNKPNSEKGIVEVFDYSAKDGSVQDLVIVPVTFILK